MAQRVVLHIGLMKSGTTYLQGRMNANRGLLAEQDILFPGPNWGRHARAVGDLLGSTGAKRGAWAGLVEEINAHPGTAIVSMEFLGPAAPEVIDRIRRDFADTRVDAVLTVRDLGRTVPAMWQETMKNRKTWPWEAYLKGIRRGGSTGKRFWRQQGAGRIAETWASGLGKDHVYVVTVPPAGSPSVLLWDRFSSVAGIAPADWQEAPRANESLGVTSALLMGRINAHVEDYDLGTYNSRVKTLGKHVLSERRSREAAIGFTVPAWLRKRSDETVRRIERAGVHVVGSLDELAPVDVPGTDPASISVEEQLDVAVEVLAVLLRSGAVTRKRAGRVQETLARYLAR